MALLISIAGIEPCASAVKSSTTRWYPITTGTFAVPSQAAFSRSMPVHRNAWQLPVLSRARNMKVLSGFGFSQRGNPLRHVFWKHIADQLLTRADGAAQDF